MHLLIVEDDPRLGKALSRLLTADRHVVELATTGQDGLELAVTGTFDAVILDVGLPDRSGLEVARRLRSQRNAVPILMLTARDAVRDRVDGLDAGADDYVVKPFAYEEVAARLRALVRRGPPDTRADTTLLRAGPVTLDETAAVVTVEDREVVLSPREFSLLECLLRHPDQVLSRDQLLDHAWPVGVGVTLNTVDVYISFLRRKLGTAGSAVIETVRGRGYRIRSDSPVTVPD